MPLEPGFLLQGRYRIERILGQGGMGAVYLAIDENLGVQCAVKENLSPSPDAERLFKREATLLAALNHHHLPRVTNHFASGDGQYLVMDYVEGEDLKERLTREGPLPEKDVARWGAQICEALAYLHSRTPSIIHRDVKPANIKLTPSGEVVLVDFGIAKTSDPSQKTTTSAVALTPGFAPPEQYGMGRTSPRTDQYALAATLYNLLTNEAPPDSVERLIGNRKLTPPEELRPQLSPQLVEALKRGLELKPDDRYADMLTFKAALLQTPTGIDPVALSQEATLPLPKAFPLTSDEPATKLVSSTQGRLPESTRPVHEVAPAGARFPSWILPAGIGGAVVLVLGLLGSFFFTPKATTPEPTTPAVIATTVPAPTATHLPPTFTATVADTLAAPTASPSPTTPPTETPVPSPTPLPTVPGTPVGGGGRIAFISNRDGQFFQVYTMNGDGSDVQQVTKDSSNKWERKWYAEWLVHGTQLAWSPDGTRLLYVAPGTTERDGLDIWMINADGTGALDLTASNPSWPAGNDFHPTWCADGRIWFTSFRVNNVPQVFYMTLDDFNAGRRPHNFSADHASPKEQDPELFPDCKSVLVVTSDYDKPELRYIAVDGSRNRTFRSQRHVAVNPEDPAISPDGETVVFTGFFNYVIIATSSKMDDITSKHELTAPEEGRNYSPAWSPDSRMLVFVSERDQNREVYLMAAGGQDQRNLTNNAAVDTDPVWQPLATP